MAIGLGRMFGFRLPENFARPYSAASITDFWRRWHISLSRWFRDYLYVPLGGNRNSDCQTYRNLSIVFLLTGLWHGANWTFMRLGRVPRRPAHHRAGHRAQRAPTARPPSSSTGRSPLVLVMVGWVFFRSPTMSVAPVDARAMFSPAGLVLSDLVRGGAHPPARGRSWLSRPRGAPPARWFVVGRFLDDPARQDRVTRWVRVAVAGTLGPVGALTVAAGSFSPFLYFQF